MSKISLLISIIFLFLNAPSRQVFAQSSFGANKVKGIRIVVEQERPPIKRLGKVKSMEAERSVKAGDAMVSPNKNLVLKNNQTVSEQLNNDLQNKVAASGAYVSPSKPSAQKSSSQNNSNQNSSANNASDNYVLNTVFTSNDLFEWGFIQRTYNIPEFRGKLAEALKSAINAQVMKSINPQYKKDGFGIHSRTNLQLGNLQIESDYLAHSQNPSVTINFTIPRNRYFVQITTPTVFGSDADPNAVVFFDLIISTSIQLPVNTSQVSYLPKLGDIHIVATNISKPESRNWISKLVIEFGPLLSGRDFINELRQDKYFVFPMDQYNRELDRMRQSLKGISSMRIENYPDGNMVILKATTKPEEQIRLH